MNFKRNLLILATMFLGAFTAKAADFNQDKQLLREAVNYARNYEFRMSFYKLRAIKVDVSDLAPSPTKRKLIDALNVAMEKSEDPYLYDYEKADIIEDCARVAHQALVDLQRGGGGQNGQLDRALKIMQKVLQSVDYAEYQKAQRKLNRILDILDQYRNDQKIRKAIDAVQVIKQKLSDPYLSDYEKYEITADCKRVFDQAIKTSRSYRRGNRRPRVEFNLQGKVRQGKGRYSSYGTLKAFNCRINPNNAYITYKNRGVALTHQNGKEWSFQTSNWNRKKTSRVDMVVFCGGQEFRLRLYK